MKNMLLFPFLVLFFLWSLLYVSLHLLIRNLHDGCLSLSEWWQKGDRVGVLFILAIISVLASMLLNGYTGLALNISYQFNIGCTFIHFLVFFLVSSVIVIPYHTFSGVEEVHHGKDKES